MYTHIRTYMFVVVHYVFIDRYIRIYIHIMCTYARKYIHSIHNIPEAVIIFAAARRQRTARLAAAQHEQSQGIAATESRSFRRRRVAGREGPKKIVRPFMSPLSIKNMLCTYRQYHFGAYKYRYDFVGINLEWIIWMNVPNNGLMMNLSLINIQEIRLYNG